MRTIWKFPLEVGSTRLSMPREAKVLSVQVQGESPETERPCIWAEVETENEVEERTFAVVGTGHTIPESMQADHIGTFQLLEGRFVGHLYEVAMKEGDGQSDDR